ncbi:bifunctional (p)ppGpp synthetase/guanosine-3',5'-bis(diphosphate) 3'-pyrophosphohydrolase [Dysgonomonas sp. 216]|uniref:RelA/SpoT family protein n=1 Tax=Dysgonomonas sp. 216 TaxID=2302934 RepID=UPI0013D45197|nr:TGS domain-containing protein [Dysgonomonas sp. 216]NDW18511.1 bifunctional (p)ppGpp synthetase/guanosine-3',5'-bis(diphosphate) 3'-pyrophosphohydrolase [Dysgonomonas sp. 216]
MTARTRNTISLYKRLFGIVQQNTTAEELVHVRHIIKKSLAAKIYNDGKSEFSEIKLTAETILVIVEELNLKGTSILGLLLFYPTAKGIITRQEVDKLFGADIATIVDGLTEVRKLESRHTALKSENFINLLLSFAKDVRVILIMVASRLALIREASERDEQFRLSLCVELSYLYIPLAHKTGLYKIKSEMEDLYLKYTDRDSFDYISRKINETKESRDKYIAEFIAPIKDRLKKTGLKYEIKGRTKSIFSINNKLKKQKIEFEAIYDLFAIRIVLDSTPEREKAECWQIYSEVTDLYQPNPKRMKDWLSVPKSNGYESLHTTVMGPGSRWVEVQIRTQRMDEIAERGLAAHWRYKGVKSQSNLDDWLNTLRETLENNNLQTEEKLQDFKLGLYDEEIYVFTPKGELHKLPKGATVLDFAFSIHSKLGATCVSGKVNDRNESIRYKLKSGDIVEVLTSSVQSPKRDWLSFVVTSKARNKIRQSLKEEANKQVDIAKELLKRRMKNRKIDEDEAILMRLIKKLGFKTVTDFYVHIADESLDVNNVIDQYLELEKKETEIHDKHETVSADNFVIQNNQDEYDNRATDELIIDQNLTGVDYKLAKCCNPIYGDEIFGFVSTQGIKIHRKSCPNAHDMFSRFGYRIIPARWTGKQGSQYPVNLRIIGNDDISIVTNLSSIISKENGVSLRSINIDSNDGLFHGNVTVMLTDTNVLNGLMKKLRTVKGVKQVLRVN